MTEINQVRMSQSGSDTNYLKGIRDMLPAHTHTQNKMLLHHQQANQSTITPDRGTSSHGKSHWQSLVVVCRQVPTFQLLVGLRALFI